MTQLELIISQWVRKDRKKQHANLPSNRCHYQLAQKKKIHITIAACNTHRLSITTALREKKKKATFNLITVLIAIIFIPILIKMCHSTRLYLNNLSNRHHHKQ